VPARPFLPEAQRLLVPGADPMGSTGCPEGIWRTAVFGEKLLKGTQPAELLGTAMECLSLSARAYDRVLREAPATAPMVGQQTIADEHGAEAMEYRSRDRALRREGKWRRARRDRRRPVRDK